MIQGLRLPGEHRWMAEGNLAHICRNPQFGGGERDSGQRYPPFEPRPRGVRPIHEVVRPGEYIEPTILQVFRLADQRRHIFVRQNQSAETQCVGHVQRVPLVIDRNLMRSHVIDIERYVDFVVQEDDFLGRYRQSTLIPAQTVFVPSAMHARAFLVVIEVNCPTGRHRHIVY